VLLAGDAAHLNNPIGAFGLNSGVHDAVNLTDKVVRICRGGADAAPLGLYVGQRRPLHLEYIPEFSGRDLKRLNEKSGPLRRENSDWLRRQAATKEGCREFLLVSSMIASIRRANSIA